MFLLALIGYYTLQNDEAYEANNGWKSVWDAVCKGFDWIRRVIRWLTGGNGEEVNDATKLQYLKAAQESLDAIATVMKRLPAHALTPEQLAYVQAHHAELTTQVQKHKQALEANWE